MSFPLAGRAILLVEDDRGVQRTLADALADAGFTVFTERDGDWALRTFQARPIDLAVIDVLLPGRGGLEVAQELRASEKGRALPIIMSSGVVKGQKGRRDLADKLGAKAPLEWMDKPFEPSKLVAACQRLLQLPPEETDPETRRRRRERARLEAHAKDLSSLADLQEAKGVESESQVRFRGAATVRGNLRDAPFAEVLSQLHRWRANGALLVRADPVKKIVYLKEGTPLFVRSNLLAECLGQVLVRERMITVAECEESLRRMQTERRQQGTLLIEMGCISPQNLAYALQVQQETKLYDLFGWAEGDYSFNPRAETPSSLVALESTSARVLFEGISRTYAGPRVRAALGAVEGMSVRLTDDPMDRFQDMGLESEAAQVLAAVDGRRTVAGLLEVARAQGLQEDDAYRLIYALKCANMIQLTLAAAPAHAARDLAGAGLAELRLAMEVPPPPVDDLPARALPEPELAARQQIERLAARAQDLRRGSLYDALGVSRAATEFEVRQAFARLAKETHPDRLGPEASSEARAIAEEIFQQVVHAHEVLTDRQRRAAYETELRAGAVRSDSDDVARILAAEERFREGELLLKQRDFARAQAAFESAVRLYPDEAEFHACLAWAAWSAQAPGPQAAAQAQAALGRALELNPRMDRAYVYLGHIQRALGNTREAEAEFEKALTCNPACAEALKELRLARR